MTEHADDGPDATTSPTPPPRQRLLLLTGLSGAGKTTALKSLEDLGYESIDHLPLYFLGRLLPVESEGVETPAPLAVGVDVRTRDFQIDALIAIIDKLRRNPRLDVGLVFLHCDTDELARRYTVTRHRHPLAVDLPLNDGIDRERQMLAPLRACADLVIDTTALAPGDLKRLLEGHYDVTKATELLIQVMSFSYRSGLPREADLVFDVRFLDNPHYDPDLRPLTGRDDKVARFIAADACFAPFFENLTRLLAPLLPRYASEGKSYLTLAIGCTGGRHRSVFIAEQLAAWLATRGRHARIRHRDLERSRR